VLVGLQRPIQYPLKPHATFRVFADQTGTPVRLKTLSHFTLTAHMTQANITKFAQKAAGLGFNGIAHMLLVNGVSNDNQPVNEPNDKQNVAPFTTPNFLDTANRPYFDNVATAAQKLRKVGMMLNTYPAYCGFGGGSQGVESSILTLAHNTDAIAREYGRNVRRWLKAPNINFLCCGDHTISGTALSRMQQIWGGMQEVDRLWLAGSELDSSNSIATDQTGFTYGPDPATADVHIQSCYTVGDLLNVNNGRSFQPIDRAWAQGSMTMPVMGQETPYLNSTWHTNVTTPRVRRSHHWGITAGSWGGMNWADDDTFNKNTESVVLATLDTNAALDAARSNFFYDSLPWYRMRPSGTATGYCGRTLIVSSNVTTTDSYVSASMSSDGKCLVFYVPDIEQTGTRNISLDLRSMAGNCRLRWVDMTTGQTSSTGLFPKVYESTESNGAYNLSNTATSVTVGTKGPNSRGTDADWVGLVEAL
jgi:hypothetical protein